MHACYTLGCGRRRDAIPLFRLRRRREPIIFLPPLSETIFSAASRRGKEEEEEKRRQQTTSLTPSFRSWSNEIQREGEGSDRYAPRSNQARS